MSAQSGSQARGGSPGIGGKAGKRIVVGLVVALVAYALLRIGTSLWTDKLWYDSVDASTVFRNRILTQVGLFVGGFLVTAGLIWLSMRTAYRYRPIEPPSGDPSPMERYRAMIEPVRRASFLGMPAFFGLFGGTVAAGQWRLAMLWWNGGSFGTKDPQFGKDIGFYVFSLPWWEFVLTALTLAVILATVAGTVTMYIYGGISLTRPPKERFTTAARIQLAVLIAALLVTRALGYWLARYNLTTKDARLFNGVDYTADHAQLPTNAVLAVAAILCAGMFVATIWTKTWRVPVIGVVSMLVLTIGLGGVYPALVSNFKVNPNARELEAPYIERNIAATREAFGVSDVVASAQRPETTATAQAREQDAASVPGIRLVDPMLVSPTLRQGELRQYYQYPDVLDVDRYTIGGKPTDVVVGVRELDQDGIPAGQRNWVNERTVFTHGYGLVAVYGNQREADGRPKYIDMQKEVGPFEPRIYFGEFSPSYSIVGAPDGASPTELDYPNSDGQERRYTYKGNGGVGIGSFPRRMAYALKYNEYNFLFSDAINDQSRILDVRDPVERVRKTVPWLTVDGDPLPVVANGRVQWIVDGYTTTARYPNSTMQATSSTQDSLTQSGENVRGIRGGDVNYIRNSVKATVDAYSGEVKVYEWDSDDPMLKAWSKAFPGTVQPRSAMPKQVMEHVRYPTDMFKLQRQVLTRYHVKNPSTFFSGTEVWQVPNDPTRENRMQQPPYYLRLATPGTKDPTFSLSSTFIPTGEGRQNLASFLAVDSDARPEKGKPLGSYGTMRLWTMPGTTTIKGPAQFQNDVRSSNEVNSSEGTQQTLSQFLANNEGRVQFGNLLTLPFGGGLLYVEPIYVRNSGQTGFPLQRAVVVQFGEKLAWGNSLEDALTGLFGASGSGDSGADSGAGSGDGDSGDTSKEPKEKDSVAKAVKDAGDAWDRGEAALKRGDLAGYQKAMKEMKAALDRIEKLENAESSAE